jgi:hypothetical protein
MSAPVRESKTSCPPWTHRSFRSDVALRNLLRNTALTAPPARATRESPTSCALPSPTFPLAQHHGSFFSLRFEPWLLARVGETYTTPEWVHRALHALGNLLRTTRLNLSTPVISRAVAVAALFFGVTLANSLCVEAATPLLPHDDPPGQTNAAWTSEPSLPGAAPPQQKSYGTVSGRVVDQNDNALAGTNVQIKSSLESAIQEVQSAEDGRFDFDRVPPGPFQLTTMAEGFVTQTISNTLRPGEDYVVPPITMSLAMVVTEVRVLPSTEEIAQEEFKELEQQRVLGIVPNFYVSYVGEAAPLTPKRKFELALKATTDPVTTMAVATIAGVNQATNRFSGYG